jgi:hypothetical protein
MGKCAAHMFAIGSRRLQTRSLTLIPRNSTKQNSTLGACLDEIFVVGWGDGLDRLMWRLSSWDV